MSGALVAPTVWASSFSESHPPPLLLMWKISSAVPSPPFLVGQVAMETASCLGWGLRGLGAGRDGNGDFGLSVPLLLRPKSPPSGPLPRTLAPCKLLSTFLSVFLHLSLFLSLIFLPLHLCICLPGFPSSQPPPPSPLGWLPFCPRPGQALMSSPPKRPRKAWPGHTLCLHKAVGAGVRLTPAPLQNIRSSP